MKHLKDIKETYQGSNSRLMEKSPNEMLKLRKCCKCGAIDNIFDDTVEEKYSVTADTCEKCGFGQGK